MLIRDDLILNNIQPPHYRSAHPEVLDNAAAFGFNADAPAPAPPKFSSAAQEDPPPPPDAAGVDDAWASTGEDAEGVAQSGSP